jgi:FMN phosphatase YigB (HAD superfamily)
MVLIFDLDDTLYAEADYVASGFRQVAAAIAARGKLTKEQAMQKMAEQNVIRRMHTPDEVAATVARLVAERPLGCTFVMDRDPPAFLD